MSDKKTPLTKEVSDTMACSAFAEAGEPCPIDSEKNTVEQDTDAEEKKSTLKSVSDTMACSAYAEAGEPCPIDDEAKTDTKE